MDLPLPLTHLILVQEPWESKYDFVWGLDSDVDLTGIRGDLVVGATCWGPILPWGFGALRGTNLTKLFRMVQESGALIAGPTFIGAGRKGYDFFP